MVVMQKSGGGQLQEEVWEEEQSVRLRALWKDRIVGQSWNKNWWEEDQSLMNQSGDIGALIVEIE